MNLLKSQPMNTEGQNLINKAKKGDDVAVEYLFHKYEGVMYWKATRYFFNGAEREDLLQEAMLGLFKAIRDFSPEKEASFHTFAKLCIQRQLVSALKRAMRKKNYPLNHALSLDKPLTEEDGSNWTLLDIISERNSRTPEEILIEKERCHSMATLLTQLTSPFEKEVLQNFIEGRSHKEIAKKCESNTKAVDNALQRVKKKILARKHSV